MESFKKHWSFKPFQAKPPWGVGFSFFLAILAIPLLDAGVVVWARNVGFLDSNFDASNMTFIVLQLTVLLMELVFIGLVLKAKVKDKRLFSLKPVTKALGLIKPTKSQYSELLKTAAGYFFVLFFILSPLVGLLPESITSQEQQIGLDKTTTSMLEIALSGLILLVLVPIVEEVLYRGVVFRSLTRSMTMPIAAVVSSVLFALAHFNIVVGIDTFVLGILLCLVYSRTKNLWMAVALHSVKNSIAFVLLFFTNT
ncbi:TPA: CPBP family intramembrane metalloprotease [Candidatus Saccharibacteria bacterium]|nr:CPBP family intramembrane metalloprotease [Candidatus Saccharibacteria bacterium]HIO87225.1 CPBP family intramembrane metalloprotease [Candidatus Saccharibacteria bacterium]